MRRLLQNLISNAIKYTPSGRVLVGARRRGAHLVLEVWDTGLGIPPSKQRIVFREFQRLDQGVKVARGLGLGLSIVERIGRVLKHPITLNSEAGRGSVFRVEVPVVAALPATAAAPELPKPPATVLSGLRVLVIDNEPAILEGMRLLLSGWGCEVWIASDLETAHQALRTHKALPEVIVADYHLDETRRPRAHQGPALEDAGRHAGRSRHRRPHPGRARRRRLHAHPRPQQAAEAGGSARAADAMARDQGGGGVRHIALSSPALCR